MVQNMAVHTQILSLFTLLDQQPDTVFALSLFQRINADVCV